MLINFAIDMKNIKKRLKVSSLEKMLKYNEKYLVLRSRSAFKWKKLYGLIVNFENSNYAMIYLFIFSCDSSSWSDDVTHCLTHSLSHSVTLDQIWSFQLVNSFSCDELKKWQCYSVYAFVNSKKIENFKTLIYSLKNYIANKA